jgi:hypothetical protein
MQTKGSHNDRVVDRLCPIVRWILILYRVWGGVRWILMVVGWIRSTCWWDRSLFGFDRVLVGSIKYWI